MEASWRNCGFRRRRTLIPKGTRTAFRAEGEQFRSEATLASRLCRKCSSSSRETYPERSAGRARKRRKGCGKRGGSPFPCPALERPRRASARRLRGATLFAHRVTTTGYSQVVEEVAASAVTKTYAYGLQRISQTQWAGSTPTVSFYDYDGQGNVRLLTDATGTVTDTYDYDSFGNALNVTGTTPNVYRFGGEQMDSDLGLYYLRAYNPRT